MKARSDRYGCQCRTALTSPISSRSYAAGFSCRVAPIFTNLGARDTRNTKGNEGHERGGKRTHTKIHGKTCKIDHPTTISKRESIWISQIKPIPPLLKPITLTGWSTYPIEPREEDWLFPTRISQERVGNIRGFISTRVALAREVEPCSSSFKFKSNPRSEPLLRLYSKWGEGVGGKWVQGQQPVFYM